MVSAGSADTGKTYSVCASEFLLCADDGAGPLRGVEGCGAAYDSFAVAAGAAGAGFAADAGHVVPVLVGHCGCDGVAVGWWRSEVSKRIRVRNSGSLGRLIEGQRSMASV